MQGQRWSQPIWHRFAASPLWDEGIAASMSGRLLPDGYLRLYGLFEPDPVELRYIGLTGRQLDERLYGHLKDARGGSDTYKARWIRSLDEQPIIYEIMQLEEPIAHVAEQLLIAVLMELGVPLTNTHAGGGGFDAHGDDARERMRESIRAAHRRGAYTREMKSKASKKAWESRRRKLVSGELKPQVAWNAGKKLGPNPNISAGRLKGKKPQPELVQMVADEAGLSYAQTYRSIKGTGVRPPENVVLRAWEAYDRLGEAVADLRVKNEARP